ncbi:hypothetical protein [Cupriavidus pauculus]|uniref:hypothetical protein n=1 Tax=Cupriavidus pauculus TaxID=82633 RepID=UPI001CC3289C|nr:hypothetical protein [Cupriavidus pauculus]
MVGDERHLTDLAGTDLIATLAGRAAVRLAVTEGLTVHPLPADLGPDRFSIDMVWSKRAAGDAAITWLRAQVMAVAAEMAGSEC